MKELGVRELSYSLVFLAVHSVSGKKKKKNSSALLQGLEEESLEDVKKLIPAYTELYFSVKQIEVKALLHLFGPNLKTIELIAELVYEDIKEAEELAEKLMKVEIKKYVLGFFLTI